MESAVLKKFETGKDGESQESREPDPLPERSNCALGVFVHGGSDRISYFGLPQRMQASQGEFRGGGGRGLVTDGMTLEQARAIIQSNDRPGAIRMFGPTHRVDLGSAKKLQLIQLHAQGHPLDSIVKGIEASGARPLYVESIATNPGALSFRTFRDTYGDISPGEINTTFLRVFVDNPTKEPPAELQQRFNEAMPGPVIMSWGAVSEEFPGLMCYRMAGKGSEFDGFFGNDIRQFSAKRFYLQDRYPTQQSEPGVENSQPRVQDMGDDYFVADHNGDMVNAEIIKQRLLDPYVHEAERKFFEAYGMINIPPKKFQYRHIASVDSSVVAKLHAYLFDCCKRHGIDTIIISLFERPPSLAQIRVMPSRERKFFLMARAAFPEISFQGSAATVVATRHYVRVTADRTRVCWIGKDKYNNVYVASNGGAITAACSPEDLVAMAPAGASETIDIDLHTGNIINRGFTFSVPTATGKMGDDSRPTSVFVPGIGFRPQKLDAVSPEESEALGLEHKRKPLPEKEEPKLPEKVSSLFGICGFEQSDLKRAIHYGHTGTYLATGLGNAEPDGIMKRATTTTALSSLHQAFIVSPGRDNRIEFSARTLLRNGETGSLMLRSPILVGSTFLENSKEGKSNLHAVANKYGTIGIDQLQDAVRVKATYGSQEKLADALTRITHEVEEAARGGARNIVLSDNFGEGEIPIPPSVIVGVIHHALRKMSIEVRFGSHTVLESLRSRVNLIGDFQGVNNIEELRECIMHGADAICPPLLLDASMNIFQNGNTIHEKTREDLILRGLNALCGLEEDFAIAAGSSGFHDVNAMRGNAAGMEYELGIADDLNERIGNIPGMNAGGVDLVTLDLFLRSRFIQYGKDHLTERKSLPAYEGKWERWNSAILAIVDRMAHDGASYQLDPQEYANVPVVTMEDMVKVRGLENFQNFPDEELRKVDFRVLDFIGVMVAHMSIGANNIETWIAILAALYEIRHEASEGMIPFLNELETLILAGIGEGGIAAELRMFLAHLCGQYASGRFGIETNDGDIFDRERLQKEGLLRMKGVQGGEFDEKEISEIEKMMAQLIPSKYIEKDLKDLEEGKLQLLCRFICIVSVKNAQDAKRGYGGMMAKTIMLIARIRGVTPYDIVKSFFNHADGDSIEELRERIFCLMREAGGEIPELGDQEVCVSSKDANDPYMVPNMFGEVKAGAVMVDHDWGGGTGNRPVGTKRVRHPWVAEASRLDALDRNMLGMMTMNWMSSNRTPVDALRNLLLGNVDGMLIATSLLRAMKCVIGTCRECNTGKCPPVLTDQGARRLKLYTFDSSGGEDPDSKKVDMRQQKDRAKRLMLAFIRTMKTLMKNVDAKNITEAKNRRDVLEIQEGVQVEGADFIRQILDHPYTAAEVERACSVSARFQLRKFIESKPFPTENIANALRTYLSLSTEGIPNPQISRNAFLVMGDIANIFPKLSSEEQKAYLDFLHGALTRVEATYRHFLTEKGKPMPTFNRDNLLQYYKTLDHNEDRDEQEFLERLITGYRLIELAEKFHQDDNEHQYKDDFFARTKHAENEKTSIKSPRAIISQENGFSIDRYRGVQRKIAAKIIEHLRTHRTKTPLIIEIDEPLSDKDMGILSCLNALYHHFPREFKRTVASIELRLRHGVSGHNLGALVNGNYIFGPKNARKKLRIVVGSPKHPAHGDGSVGMGANGATIEVSGYIGDCGAAYASDTELACRGSSVKLGMGAKGNTFIYSHEPLQDVAGIGMNGNATIFCAGRRRPGEEGRAIAKPGLGGDAQGLTKIVLAASKQEVENSHIVGVGAMAKKLSRLDEKQARVAYRKFYPRYERGKEAEPFDRESHSKIVSEHYYRNAVTSLLVFDFYRMRDDVPYQAQLESVAGELLEMAGIDDMGKENEPILIKTMQQIETLKVDFYSKWRDGLQNKPSDTYDPAFKDAKERAVEFLASFKHLTKA